MVSDSTDAPTTPPSIDVLAVGNALVDILSHEEHEFLSERGLVPGSMSLVDESEAGALYESTSPSTEVSGGSAANTVAGVASFGGSAHFIGRVRDDQLGDVFTHDIRSIGVGFTNAAATTGSPTGRCLVLVTPDAQRTLNTYLGASAEFAPDDVDASVVASAGIVYLEGYLYDSDAAKNAFAQAALAAKSADRSVALTLSDSFCVDRHRDSFLEFIAESVDVLFANEDELAALMQSDDFEAAKSRVSALAPVVAITRSARGSVVVTPEREWVVAAEPIAQVVDTTGAGDQYAAGFLFGLSRGENPGECARLGHVAAAEVISHLGARPEVPLASLL